MASERMKARERHLKKYSDKYGDRLLEYKKAVKESSTYQDKMKNMLAAQAYKNASLVKQRTRCRLCGRPRGVYKFFQLCRMCIRKHMQFIPGLMKY